MEMVESNYAVGVDIGGTNIRVAVGYGKGRILSRSDERSDKSSGPLGISKQIARMIRVMVPKKKIRCIGIGSAGPLDLGDGSIVHSPHLGFDHIPLVKPLKKELKVPVHLVNDCVAAVIAEKEYGHGRKCANLVYVTISSGIGAGVFVDDHLLMGKDGNAHEVGHITIDHKGKLLCGCGKRGHWEAYCGGNNALNFARYWIESKSSPGIESSLLLKISDNDLGKLSSRDIFDSASKGDKLALEIVEEIGRLNAIGFANITNVYDPELITVGGAIPLANPNMILTPIRRLINQHNLNRIPRIELTKLGEDSVLHGALALSKKQR
jgi:glucokinase